MNKTLQNKAMETKEVTSAISEQNPGNELPSKNTACRSIPKSFMYDRDRQKVDDGIELYTEDWGYHKDETEKFPRILRIPPLDIPFTILPWSDGRGRRVKLILDFDCPFDGDGTFYYMPPWFEQKFAMEEFLEGYAGEFELHPAITSKGEFFFWATSFGKAPLYADPIPDDMLFCLLMARYGCGQLVFSEDDNSMDFFSLKELEGEMDLMNDLDCKPESFVDDHDLLMKSLLLRTIDSVSHPFLLDYYIENGIFKEK
jgi:hypothetical protein